MEIQDNDYPDDEYINNDNDPEKVIIVPEDDYVISDNEEIIEHEEILASVDKKIKNLSNYDHIMEEKVLNALRKGKFR